MSDYLAATTALFLFAAAAAGGDVGFVEDFALAKDRATALKQLIPGTEDYYYYHALHHLNGERFDEGEKLFGPWTEKFGETPRLTELRIRHALLTYDRDPQKTLAFLRHRYGVQFNHQRVVPGGVPDLPTALDPMRIARATLRTDSLRRWLLLENFEDSALDWLATEELNTERRRIFLSRLTRPDLPNLVPIVAADLARPNAGGFGEHAVHSLMTLAQLDDLLKVRPQLLNQTAYAHAYQTKLHPGADADWRRDPAQTRAYFDKLLGFVRRLNATHNALKAHVLYHRLTLDRAAGAPDRDLFIEYLKLPRQQHYMAPRLLESDAARVNPANLGQDFSGSTLLGVVGADEPLVRAYLKHFFAKAESPREFEPYVNDVYLRHLFAETKIELGLGEPERWAADLPPEMFAALKERVDIDFDPTNRTQFKPGEPVKLDLHVKNVSTLIVKVFEINAANFYRTQKREIDTDVNLDGLVANAEQTHTYPDPPLRRMNRRFDFPEMDKPGVYVVDFIGSGKSSRALVRKGRLRPLATATANGLSVAIVDDANKLVSDAAVWLGGKEYAPGKDGRVLIPYSAAPGRQPVVLTRGDFASLDYLDHQAESFHLTAGIYVDREALLTQRLANVIVRPGVTLNGLPASVTLLGDAKLTLSAVDHDGIATTSDVPDFKLFEDRDSTFEFRVPPRLASLTVTLTGTYKALSRGTVTAFAAAETFAVNRIDTTDHIADLHLAKFGTEFWIELLGRTGEPKADRTVNLSVKHRDFKEPVNATLKTDARGRVRLGELADIVHVTATGPHGVRHFWPLPRDRSTYRTLVHAKAGAAISLPYVGTAAAATRAEFALLELVAGTVRGDRFDAVAIKDGSLEIAGLPAGDYDLYLKAAGEKIHLRVVDGPEVAGHVLGAVRHMELPRLAPVQIASVVADEKGLTVKLKDASKFARVHVFATRYIPAHDAFAHFGKVRDGGLSGVYPGFADSVYLTGRNIGDEYRYVLDRKMQKKYPGNMLARPELLLNPWAVRATVASEQLAATGGDFGGVGGAVPPAAAMPAPASERGGEAKGMADARGYADLDFLVDAARVHANLVPDKAGIVTLTKAELGSHGVITVVVVDPLHTAVKTIATAEIPAEVRDLRLRAGFDPKGHFAQQKQVSVLAANQPFVLADAAAARFEAYDSIARVHALYATLNPDPRLGQFAFVLTWPTLTPEQRREKYSEHACHELNFFLMKKDPPFFNTVVKPYLANKKDKTFLDHYLLGDDLAGYLQPWAYGRLNAVERVLLARRVPGEPAKTARHLEELFKLLPPNSDRTRMLYETAVKSGALDRSGRLAGFKALDAGAAPKMQAAAMDQMNRLEATTGAAGRMAGGLPAPAPPGGPGGGGGFGGGGRPGDAPADVAKPAGEPLAQAEKSLRMRRDARGDMAKKEVEQLAKDKQSEELGEASNGFFSARLMDRAATPLYRKIDVTMEWAENNYHKLPIQAQVAALVPVNAFWVDYAKHDDKGPFLSRHFAEAGRNFTELMFALAVLDLPLAGGKHDIKFDGGKMTFTPVGPAVAFHEEVKPTGPVAGNLPVLVSQNFYKAGDRYRDENGERLDKFVTGEFVAQTVYGCQVVVTNPSPSRQRLSVLVQVPVGAISVANGQATKSVPLDLEPYRTATLDYLFYFPLPGQFAHFPVHVAKGETPVAAAAPVVFNVVAKPTKADTESWDYVSQNGTDEQVLGFMTRENVHALALDKIAFRMKDLKFFESATTLLHSRHAYHGTLWSYALLHNAPAAAQEFLRHNDQLATETGGPIRSPLYLLDPVERHSYEHLEYKPLVNARAHALGQRRQIVNDRLHAQYHRFLKVLTYRNAATDDDKLATAYYLLLQDRIAEAAETFAAVNAANVPTRMQYDLCAAYLAMFEDDPAKAKVVAAKYAAYPVDRWRKAFAAVADHVAEAGGVAAKPNPADDDPARKQGALAAAEPGFEVVAGDKKVSLTWQNLSAVTVNYYLMDVELLFSRNPFVQQTGNEFGLIKPNRSQKVALAAGQTKLDIPLPAELAGKNVLVEVTAAGKARSVPLYATAMDVQVSENYGQVKVSAAGSGKPLAKVYVKTYVKTADGRVKFYKDGYTDHRGRFDYATVSTPEQSPPARFAVLVLGDGGGATIREANPPQQ